MLILERRVEQKIRINDDIVITVTAIRDGKVRLGFEAPENVSIHRQEVYEDIKQHGRKES